MKTKSKTPTKPAAATELSPKRRRAFMLTVLLFPFLLLGIIEIGLRSVHYGGELDLVIRRTIGKKECYSINRSVARRYFAQAGTTIPEPADDTFEIQKRKNTKRIFCLGESTMAGFPYEFHATAPGFLRDRLQYLLPQFNIEVINVGLSAVGSFVVLDFMHELMDYEPDLFIVYVGHNEFYGAYGLGSTVAIKGGPWMTRLTLSLLKFKTFLLLRDVYAEILKWFSTSSRQATGSMMQQMAANRTIPLNSPLYAEAKEIYEENLMRVITTAQQQNVPLILSTLVSNLKDQAPLVAAFDEQTSETQRAEWQRLLTEGDSAMSQQRISDAVAKFQSASRIDTVNALAFYKLGKALLSLQNFTEAERAFTRAKDNDALRFRATEEFQNILLSTCEQFKVPVARVDSAFAANSPHGIVGEELILEHLHPNIEGYFLMAMVFTDATRREGLLAGRSDWQIDGQKSDSLLMEISTVSEFDRTFGRLKVEFLKRRWPFNTGPTNYEFIAANTIESIAFRYVQQKIGWSDARYVMAEFYANNKQFDLARKECLAVSKVIPFSYNPLLRVADYYRMEGKRKESKRAYKRCIAAEDNPYAHIKLGLTYLEDEVPGDAAKEFESAFSLNEGFGEPLSPEAASAARYLYGVAFAKMGRISDAKTQLQHALAINPNNADAKDVLVQLQGLRQ
jgi:tetratricopeptide (TPR) repeat protein